MEIQGMKIQDISFQNLAAADLLNTQILPSLHILGYGDFWKFINLSLNVSWLTFYRPPSNEFQWSTVLGAGILLLLIPMGQNLILRLWSLALHPTTRRILASTLTSYSSELRSIAQSLLMWQICHPRSQSSKSSLHPPYHIYIQSPTPYIILQMRSHQTSFALVLKYSCNKSNMLFLLVLPDRISRQLKSHTTRFRNGNLPKMIKFLNQPPQP